MARNLSKNPATNAGKLHASTRATYFVETADGIEERMERKPQGRVERFVDKDGNVVALSMYGEGDQRKPETERRNRGNWHAKGMIELGQCPLVTGTQQYATRDFIKMPASLREPCKHTPRIFEKVGRDIYAKDPCPHVKWLIEHRRVESAKGYAIRNAHVAAADKARKDEADLRKLQADLIREQIAETQTKRTSKRKDVEEK